MKKKVLFVCLGNICRSPAADGIFRKLVRDAGLSEHFQIDSAGTGAWHAGDSPDSRMIEHAKRRGYDLSELEARQIIAPDDFEEFDYILTMDNSNLRNVLALDSKRQYTNKVQPLLNFCRVHQGIKEVPDPYYNAADGFEYVLDLLEDACTELLAHIQKELR